MVFAVRNFTVAVLFEKWVVAILAYLTLLFFAAKDRVGEAVIVDQTVSRFALITDKHVTESNVLGAVKYSLFAISVFQQVPFGTVDAVAFNILGETAKNVFTDTFSVLQKQSNLTILALPSSHVFTLAAGFCSLSKVLAFAISRKIIVIDALGTCRCGSVSVASLDVVGSDTDAIDTGDRGRFADGRGGKSEGQKEGDKGKFHKFFLKI